jgi:hypothetical protein
MSVIMILVGALILMIVAVIGWGFYHFDEWEIGIEFMPTDFNNFELGVSNRNYTLTEGGLEQELRIGLLLFCFIAVFRRFDA